MTRLVDANKLIAKWKPVVKRYEGDSKYWETAYILEGVIEDVENEPTVDAERVRHGHWVDEGKKFLPIYCSRCGFGKVYEDQRNYAYCPNCGAKMDERIDTPTDPVAK